MKWQDFIIGVKDREKTKDVKTEIHAKSSKPQNKELKIEGRLEEVSPNEQWILYQMPEEEGRWDGETYKGILKALYIPTGKIIEIMKGVRYDSNVHFFSDSQLAIPREGRIELYNLDTEQWGEKALMQYNKDYFLLKLSLDEDRTRGAILLIDFASSREVSSQPDSNDRVELKVVDFKNRQEYVVDHDFDSEIACEYAGKILWNGDKIVYSILNKLYCYQLGNPQQILITNHLSSYSIKEDKVIYFIRGNDRRYTFKNFSLIDFSTKVLESNLESDQGDPKNAGTNERILYKSDHLIIEYSPESVYKLAINGY